MTSWASKKKNGATPRWTIRGRTKQLPMVRYADFKTTAAAVAEAERRAAEAEREERRTGVDPTGGQRTVAEAHGHLVDHETSHLSLDSRSRDESLWRNHVEPRWGHVPLDEVRRDKVQRWVDDVLRAEKGLAPATVQKVVGILNKTVEHAILMEWTDHSGVAGVRMPPARRKRSKAQKEAETDAMLSEVDDHWLPFVAFMATSPVRPGEAMGLPVRNLDPTTCRVWVEQQWTERHGGVLKLHTKNGRPGDPDPRWVPVAPDVMEAMVELGRGRGPDEFVFLTEADTPISLGNFNSRILAPACRRAGIPVITAYALRHTSVTRMVEKLHNVYHRKVIATWAGHSDRTMADVYLQVGTDFEGDELAAMSGAMKRRRKGGGNVVPLPRRAG